MKKIFLTMVALALVVVLLGMLSEAVTVTESYNSCIEQCSHSAEVCEDMCGQSRQAEKDACTYTKTGECSWK